MMKTMIDKNQISDNIAIHLEDVNIRYRMLQERTTSLKEFTLDWIKGKNSYTHFWALRDITLKVDKGESIGIIGDKKTSLDDN